MLGGGDIKKMASGLLHHHHGPSQQHPQQQHQQLPIHHPSSTSGSITPESIRQEKQFVAQFSEEQPVLPPDQIQQAPRNKALGGSSKGLTLRDFELVRTLGTGGDLPLSDSYTLHCFPSCNYGNHSMKPADKSVIY